MRPLEPLRFPLDGVRLIEASAGTGKTHAITTLYLRALLERRLEVPQILVVTFTNAAAEELRDRIRKRIAQALDALDGRPCEDESLASLMDRFHGCNDARQWLEDSLSRMDEAAVFTIHAFCQRVLMEHAFESGCLFEIELSGDDHELRMEVMRDFWRHQMHTRAAGYLEWMTNKWATPDSLASELREVPHSTEFRLEPPVNRKQLAQLEKDVEASFVELSRLWRSERDTIFESLSAESSGLKKNIYSKSALSLAHRDMHRFLSRDWPAMPLPAKHDLFTTDKLASATTRKGVAPDLPFFRLWSAFTARCGELEPLRRAELLADAIRFVKRQLPDRKAKRRTLFYDDLLSSLDHALCAESARTLAEQIRRAHPIALIDEFQDTDALQYRIFHRIYGDAPECGLHMIGDPKQSIYGFRGADIFTYMDASRYADRCGGRFALDTNWRSAGPLIHAVNTLFQRVAAPFVFQQEIKFQAVKGAGRADQEPLAVDGDDPAPFRIWWLSRERARRGRKRSEIHKLWASETVARRLAQEVVRLLGLSRQGRASIGTQGLRACDLAVLVRDRHEAEIVRRALSGEGIASVFLSQQSVFSSEEAEDLERVLRACAEPGDDRLLRAALCTRLLGVAASEIAELENDELAWDDTVARFSQCHEAWRRGDVFAVFNRILLEYRVAARLPAQANGERRLTNLLQLVELLDGEAKSRGGPDRLLRWFADRRADPGHQRDEEQLRLESDDGLIQVVTVHRSKGLEYPVVFLPFPWAARPTGNASILKYHDQDGLVVELSPSTRGGGVAAADRERLAEERRLLYVALTRAKHRCYLGWGPVAGAGQSAIAELLHPKVDATTTVLDRDDSQLLAELEQFVSESGGAATVETLDARWEMNVKRPPRAELPCRARCFSGKIERDFRLTSYSSLVRGVEDDGERPQWDDLRRGHEPPPLPQVDPAFRFARGPHAGTFLHALLEKLDFPSAKGELLTESVQGELAQHGLDAEMAKDVETIVESVLDTPLDDSLGVRLRDIARGDRRDELEFHFPLSRLDVSNLRGPLARVARHRGTARALRFDPVRGFVRGFIDLVFEFRGKVYLVDYKSNYLGHRLADYGQGGIRDAMVEHHYDLQYLIYTVALHRYLRSRIPDYDYGRHFGGVFYLFLRGMRPEHGPKFGVFQDRPESGLIAELDMVFAGGEP